MASLPDGTYYITNAGTVGSESTSPRLCVTTNGPNATVTLSPKANQENQQWVVRTVEPGIQSIGPYTEPGYLAGWPQFGGSVTVVRGVGSVWIIQSSAPGTYTIKDADQTLLWSTLADDTFAGTPVATLPDTGDSHQRWVITPD